MEDTFILQRKPVSLIKAKVSELVYFERRISNLENCTFKVEHPAMNISYPLSISFEFSNAFGERTTYPCTDIKNGANFSLELKAEDYGKSFSGVRLSANSDINIGLDIKLIEGEFQN